ncbi:glycerophosphodiester phosphodiesterase family protein [Vibrio sonorensis]|uniref:glycerophosphodiester phosphodiesterase family protein n=1 Tax=Vibrio sonorensis TaxID=1004316 RepID=UPI0008D93FB0|nr:glycerophosphodiester phosphodiesterase family protein [Vibrio sonorensis]
MIIRLLVLSIAIVVLALMVKAPSTSSNVYGDIVAYRGGGQVSLGLTVSDQVCSSENIIESHNPYIEHTFPAIHHAINRGIVSLYLNIRRTSDNDFAVFHNESVDCYTDGNGKVQELSLLELQDLDAGYRYTYDNGETYPWRNQGLMIKSLREIVEVYPHQEYWLSLDSPDFHSIESLMNYLSTLPFKSSRQLVVLSSDTAVERLQAIAPELTSVSEGTIQKCLTDYTLYGWSRFFPSSCKNTIVILRPESLEYLWGWPESFAARMAEHGSRVYLETKNLAFDPQYDLRESGVGIISGDLAAFK